MATISEDLQAFEAMVPVIVEVVPQEDVLTAFSCYMEPVVERAANRLIAEAQVENILHRRGIATPGL